MKRLLIVALTLMLLAIPQPASADVNDFVISDFSAEYLLDRDSRGVATMTVNESITVDFPQIDQNHGIERSIPLTYYDYSLGLDIASVKDETGHDIMYTTYESGGHEVLRIGNPDVFVHGPTIYNISYRLENVIEFNDNGTERFFWDINGSGWSQVFESVSARVVISEELVSSLAGNNACYTGLFGSTERACDIAQEVENGQVVVNATAEDLQPGETLTVSVPFAESTFYKDPWPIFWQRLRLSMVAVLPAATLAAMVHRWHKYGRDPRGRGVIIPQYQPPKGFNPLKADVMISERLNNRAISAALIDMAVKGHIKLNEKTSKKLIGSKSEYSLELLKSDKGLNPEYKKIIGGLFGGTAAPGSKVELKDLANKLSSTKTSLQQSIPKELHQAGFFKGELSKVRLRYSGYGALLLVLGFILLFFASTMPVGAGLIISGLVVLGFAYNMPAKTKDGVAMRDYLFGLRDYMELAEADRIEYLQSPEGVKQYGDPAAESTKVHLFETLLPYAMLFEIEEDWAKQFEHLYDEPPEWYASNSANFSSLYLAQSLNSSFNGATAAAFTPASNSGASGGGGSFSGGGGGGGGGGGW